MSEQEMIARAVKDILRGPDGEEYTDAGMEDAFFRWPVIERAILTTLASRTPGMVMVPREPTYDMQHAALVASRKCQTAFLPDCKEIWAAKQCWTAMLAASPTQSPEGAE